MFRSILLLALGLAFIAPAPAATLVTPLHPRSKLLLSPQYIWRFKPAPAAAFIAARAKGGGEYDFTVGCTSNVTQEDAAATTVLVVRCAELQFAADRLAQNRQLGAHAWLLRPSRVETWFEDVFAPTLARYGKNADCAVMWLDQPADTNGRVNPDPQQKMFTPLVTTVRVECLPPRKPGAKTAPPPVVSHSWPPGYAEHLARAR